MGKKWIKAKLVLNTNVHENVIVYAVGSVTSSTDTFWAIDKEGRVCQTEGNYVKYVTKY